MIEEGDYGPVYFNDKAPMRLRGKRGLYDDDEGKRAIVYSNKGAPWVEEAGYDLVRHEHLERAHEYPLANGEAITRPADG